jgi:competence protein ComEC
VIALTTLYRFPCRGPNRIITRRQLLGGGTHAVWLGRQGGIRVETVAGRRGARPWTGTGAGRSR